MRLPKDRVVLITGASRGIGRAVAEAFRRDGARVVAFARSEIVGLDAFSIRGDVRKPQDLTRAVNEVVARFGGLHILVTCAGIGLYSRVEDLTGSALENLFATNVFGVVYALQAALPHLRRSRGQVINISSVLARSTLPLSGAYSMTKHAIHALSVALRMELTSSGVDVVEVGPGPTETTFAASSTVLGLPEAPRVQKGGHPWTADQVARAILDASKRGRRELWLSLAGRALMAAQYAFPRLTDLLLEKLMLRGRQANCGAQATTGEVWHSEIPP